MGGLAGCRGGGGGLGLVVLVSEKPKLVSEKSGKSQGILFICGAGNPGSIWGTKKQTIKKGSTLKCFKQFTKQNRYEHSKRFVLANL